MRLAESQSAVTKTEAEILSVWRSLLGPRRVSRNERNEEWSSCCPVLNLILNFTKRWNGLRHS